MKILLFGKTGLLGNALFETLKTAHYIFAPLRAKCDITDIAALRKTIDNTKPNIVINAAGYTQVDKAEEEKYAAFKLNTEAVRNFCEILAPKKIPFVHFSTDYVFDGKKTEGYAEEESPSPLSIYGVSKAAGETEIITSDLKNYYLIRTAWLYGPGGANFVDTMLDLAQKNKPLQVVDDQIGCPTYTLDIARAVLHLIEGKNYGIYHIVNDGYTSWYNFAVEIFRQLGLPQKITPIKSRELARPARRPPHGILLNTKFPALRHWKEALNAYLKDKSLIL